MSKASMDKKTAHTDAIKETKKAGPAASAPKAAAGTAEKKPKTAAIGAQAEPAAKKAAPEKKTANAQGEAKQEQMQKKAPAKKPAIQKGSVKPAPAKGKQSADAKQATSRAAAPKKKQPGEPLRVLFAASEATPFIKTGGLADVAGTLPVALKRLDMDIRVILPKYRDIPQYWKDRMQHLTHFYVTMGWRKQYCGIQCVEYEGVTFYFVDNEFYFGHDDVYGSGQEEGERFGFFCRAVLDALQHIDFRPQVLHCNDWQTGMIPALLRMQYMHIEQYAQIRTLYTIHNMKYQGIFAWKQIDDLLGIGSRYYAPDMLEFYGDISFLKSGIVFSDKINTVSPTYAKEIQTSYYGERLDGLLRARGGDLCGILNGIDYTVWDPATDYLLENHYDIGDMAGKALSKAQLQRELGLQEAEDVMLVGMVTRLAEQKGFSLIEHVFHELMQLPIQLAVVGHGDRHYSEMLTWAQWRYQGKVAVRFEQNEWLAHNTYAGADLYLMPSRFEPCGISQMLAMRYGAVPLVRETGGLYDTVQPYNKFSDEGTGFSFANYNAHEMLYTLEQAYGYFLDKKLWSRLRERSMHMKFGWEKSAERYHALYEEIVKT